MIVSLDLQTGWCDDETASPQPFDFQLNPSTFNHTLGSTRSLNDF